MKILDKDSAINSKVNFSIFSCVFFDEEGKSSQMKTDKPFIINQNTGVITTTIKDFLDYLDGYFALQVHATDSLGRPALANVEVGDSAPSSFNCCSEFFPPLGIFQKFFFCV